MNLSYGYIFLSVLFMFSSSSSSSSSLIWPYVGFTFMIRTNSRVAPTFSFKCNKQVLDLTTRVPVPCMYSVEYCSSLTYFEHGWRSCTGAKENVYGSECSHSCDAGYALQGNSVVRCLSGSTWSAQFPSCQREYIIVSLAEFKNIHAQGSLYNLSQSLSLCLCLSVCLSLSLSPPLSLSLSRSLSGCVLILLAFQESLV